VKYYYESHYTQLKLKRHRKCTSVQKSEDHKTLMLMLLGEITGYAPYFYGSILLRSI
jgi:hypothetical protein